MSAPSQHDLTHFDSAGQAHMVDVTGKDVTHRVARATGVIRMLPATFALVAQGRASKGDVLGIARIAAIQGAKRTADLVPLCHPLPITRVAVDLELDEAGGLVRCTAQVETLGRTGVEMEALTAVQVGSRWRGAAAGSAVRLARMAAMRAIPRTSPLLARPCAARAKVAGGGADRARGARQRGVTSLPVTSTICASAGVLRSRSGRVGRGAHGDGKQAGNVAMS